MIEFFRRILESPDGKLLYVLAVICLLMTIDFITGTVSAVINTDIEFSSKTGINGILRKAASLITLVALVPLAILIPNDMGLTCVYTLYVGYLLLEFKSIIENLDKMKVDVGPFKIFLNNFEQFFKNDNK